MNCDNVKEIILSSADANYSPEMKAHLVKCDECSKLAREWSALKDIRPASRRNIPKSLDYSIVSEADIFVKSRAEHSRAVYRWLSFVSAAACVALFALAVFAVLKEKSAGKVSRSLVISSASSKPANAQEIAWDDVGFYYEASSFCEELDLYISDMHSSRPGEGESDGEFNVNIEIPEFLT
jgi:anti-sigma factor RsiW